MNDLMARFRAGDEAAVREVHQRYGGAVRTVARSMLSDPAAIYSINLKPFGTVLFTVTTNLLYGAVDRMWRMIAEESGAALVRVPIELPVDSAETIVEAVRGALDPSVRVLAIPHVAAELALRLPVEQLVGVARDHGAISVVDGAHVPGQLPLDLGSLGADFYVGNCHKWLLSPKGAGFVRAAPHRTRWCRRTRGSRGRGG